MLSIENLCVNYGVIRALDNVSFTVEEGKIVTLIGSNGAGKSSTVRCVAGLTPAASGKITFQGEDITNMNARFIVPKGISLSPEGRRIFPNLTVRENLIVGGYCRNDDLEPDIKWVYSLFPRLEERHWQLAGTLSGGEQQMLCIGRALMSRPKLLIMDEPSLGLAPLVVRDLFSIIKKINKEDGVTILLIEQNANMALQIADEAHVLETGRLTLSGTGKELLADESVKKAYLGA